MAGREKGRCGAGRFGWGGSLGRGARRSALLRGVGHSGGRIGRRGRVRRTGLSLHADRRGGFGGPPDQSPPPGIGTAPPCRHAGTRGGDATRRALAVPLWSSNPAFAGVRIRRGPRGTSRAAGGSVRDAERSGALGRGLAGPTLERSPPVPLRTERSEVRRVRRRSRLTPPPPKPGGIRGLGAGGGPPPPWGDKRRLLRGFRRVAGASAPGRRHGCLVAAWRGVGPQCQYRRRPGPGPTRRGGTRQHRSGATSTPRGARPRKTPAGTAGEARRPWRRAAKPHRRPDASAGRPAGDASAPAAT